MENKAEELAKLLGIEPKKECEHLCKHSSNEKCKLTGTGYYVDEKNCEHTSKIYPDLTKPNNFVKLLSLQANFTKIPVYFQSVEQFLSDLYAYAIVNQELKKQAQETEWEY